MNRIANRVERNPAPLRTRHRPHSLPGRCAPEDHARPCVTGPMSSARLRPGFTGWLLLLLISLIATGCAPLRKVPLSSCREIPGMPGPADLAIEERSAYGGDRLIVASQERRGLDPEDEYLNQGRIFFVPLSGSDRNSVMEFSFSGRDEYPFHPEAIDVASSGGSGYLFVANHARQDQHAIEVYRMERTSLVFLGRYRHSFFEYPVDVVGIGQDEFYVLNGRSANPVHHYGMQTIFLGSGSLVYASGNRYYRILSNLNDPSSLSLSPDGTRLWMTLEGGTRVFQRGNGPDMRPVASIGLPESPARSTFVDASTVLISTVPSPWALERYKEDPAELAPSQIYKVSASTGQSSLAYQDPGKEISGAYSLAVRGAQIFIGSPYGSGVLMCAAP